MIIYALTLRSLVSNIHLPVFISWCILLGERRFILLAVVSAAASYGIWYLVDTILGINDSYPALSVVMMQG